jgi:hypothetical protein
MQVLRDAIFVSALVTAIAYARWHFWWRSGFGRSSMCLLLSLAALTMKSSIVHWTGTRPGTAPAHVLNGLDLAAATGVLLSVLYLTYRITQTNIQQIRHPAGATEQGRRHIQRTPGATQPEIEKMLACWAEVRGLTPPHPPSR